jgi:cyclopropane fatty-acyl-phospholipid synthase-like methyltransferase
MSNPGALFDRYYATYSLKKTDFNPAKYNKEVERLDQFLPRIVTEKNAKILDLGCGNGYVLNYLKQKGFTDYLGVDFSPEAVALCKDYVTDRVIQSDALEFLEIERKSERRYDVIIMFDALHHFDRQDIIHLFKLCYEVLKPNGVLAVKVINMSNLTSNQLLAADFTNLVGFTEPSLQHLYRLAGFHSIVFDDQKPKRLSSRLKHHIERAIHRFVYWASRTDCPLIVSRKFIAIGRK